jgi:acetyl-CoA carboxylase biotin carboxyl carrier protein
MTDQKFPIDSDAIRTLAGLLDETGLTEIEVEDGDRKLRVARGGAMVMAAHPGAMPMATGAPAAAVESLEVRPAADPNHPGAVKSPMVGTAYLAPEPGAASYVKVGDNIAEGDTLLIIEAMKVMNPIRAPRGGRIASVLVESGSPVEYGQVLMVID